MNLYTRKTSQTEDFYKQKAIDALGQIKEGKYAASFKKYPQIERVLNLALVFYGKEFVCEYEFELINI
jgi:hypothetical protein